MSTTEQTADISTQQGVDLWNTAKHLIPGGNQLLSKRAEMFLPGRWPAYYERAKGCEVWDLDGNHFYDFAQMGVGSCVIGFADDDVNRAVISAITNGSMSSLNCAEEVQLAEKLVELNPWAEMARFARTGGEACAIAIRIARAAAGRGGIAFCGYHGWHDWYLAANLADDNNLDGQLLPGLKPLGVPRYLNGSARPFQYNRVDELEQLVRDHGSEIGVIIMEPERDKPPAPGFLERVREIANQIGAVLIFDEITSGFRMNVGGIHQRYGVEPDIAVYGKAMGNGFPISAIVGRRSVMDAAQETFISSTFWTERTGFVAALATLEKMQRHDVPSHLIRHGERINEGWRAAAARNGLDIHIGGMPPLTHISFKTSDPLAAQTLYTQEMLKKGYLVGAAVYTTFAYTDEIVDGFISATEDVFATIKQAHDQGDYAAFLEGPVRHAGFRRLA